MRARAALVSLPLGRARVSVQAGRRVLVQGWVGGSRLALQHADAEADGVRGISTHTGEEGRRGG